MLIKINRNNDNDFERNFSRIIGIENAGLSIQRPKQSKGGKFGRESEVGKLIEKVRNMWKWG